MPHTPELHVLLEHAVHLITENEVDRDAVTRDETPTGARRRFENAPPPPLSPLRCHPFKSVS